MNNVHDSIHANSGTPDARRALPRRRVLWLAAPVVIGIGILVLALALNVFTVSAFGNLVVTIVGLEYDPTNATAVTAGETHIFTVTVDNVANYATPSEPVQFEYRAPEVVVVHISSSVPGACEVGTPGDPDDPSICSLGSMPSDGEGGTTYDITIVVFVPPHLEAGTLLDHDVRAWQFGTEDYPPSNENHGWMKVETEADLSLSKTRVPGTVNAGEFLQYTIEISNTGPSMAHDVVFEDTMGDWPRDAYAIYNIALNTPPFSALANCTVGAADESVRCQIGDVMPGTMITGTINVYVEQDALLDSTGTYQGPSRTFTNEASVSSRTPDPGPGPNTATADTTVTAEADLAIFKSDTGSPVVAGLTTNYYFTVSNLGPSLAHCVAVTDTLPAGFTYLDGTDTCWGTADGFICNPAGLGCSDMAAGESIQFVVSVGIAPWVTPTNFAESPELPIYNDIAEVGSNTTDYNILNNTFVHATRVQDIADLQVRKLGRPDTTVVAGELMTYTIQVDNLGPSYARNTVITDTLDPDVTFVSATIAPTVMPPDLLTGEVDLVWATGTMTVTVPDPFDPNDHQAPGRVEIQVVVLVNRDINFPFDTIVNRVEVWSTAQDPNPYNNITERFTAVTAESDMQITKTAMGDNVQDVTPPGLGPAPITAQPDNVTAGTFITYTLVITNAGPTDAVNVFVMDYVPPGVEPREATITRGDGLAGECTLGGLLDGLVQCNIDTLPFTTTNGLNRATMVITGFVASSVPEGFYLNNNATVSSEYHDPDNTNDQTHNQTLANARADLVITKTARGDNVTAYTEALREFTKMQLDDAVTAGELLQYTLVVTNTGPSDAQNVVINDTLPGPGLGEDPYVYFVSAEMASCRQDDIDREKLTCYLGTMAVDEVRTIYILVWVDPAITDGFPLDNVATVDSDTHDPVTSNNTATNRTIVNAVADIFVTKVDVPIETRLNQYFEPDQAVAGKEHRYLITFGNNGPSVARLVGIFDMLDLKQADYLGETFVRCEPLDPDDLVTCSEVTTIVLSDTVRVDSLQVGNEAIIDLLPAGGTLNPGEQFGFYLITKVDPGYVLDADDTGTVDNLIAENTAFITSTTTDVRGGPASCDPDEYCMNNLDHEQTEIIAEADLKVSKTDAPDPTLPDSYLTYDPVSNKFVYTFTLTIENLGPSDAAKVVLYDWVPTDATFQLPSDIIANQIFTPTHDIQCMLRDDGLLLCLVGNDPNNEGASQRGRLNVSSVLTMTFSVEVDPSPTPRTLVNTAWVVAVAEDEYPFALGETSDDPIEPADFLDDRTPTPDQDLSNNTYTETTTVFTGRVAVDKKAYVNHSEPRGIDIPTHPIYGNLTPVERCVALAQDDILVLPGDEIVYCYTITNPGETWLRSITLQDVPNGFKWLDDPADPDDLSNYTVIYPDLSVLRGTVTLTPAAPDLDQTINISQTHNHKAVLAPAGVEDDYLAIIITRRVTVEFPELGPISGVVWEDNNGNGVVDLIYSPPPDVVQPEPLQAAGTSVALLNEAGQVLGTTLTDADGRYVFHRYTYPPVEPGSYRVRVFGGETSEVFEYDPTRGYSTANYDTLEDRWYIESNLPWIDTTFRVLGNNRAGVSALPSTKYSTEYPGVPLVFNSDLLNDTLALPVVEDTTKEWDIYDDHDGDGLPSPRDIIEYTVDIPNSGAIEATGVRFYDWLYNYINDDPQDLRVPGLLINGSVSAAIHIRGRDPVTGREIDADLQPPDLAFGEDLLLRTQAPGIDLTYKSAIVLDEEIILGNNSGDDEVFVYTRLKIPPKGYLLRFDGVTYDPPIPVTFSLRIQYQVRIKETKYVRLGTIVLNHGWVKYNEIGVFDQRFLDFDPTDPDAHTVANKAANNHAGTPYRAWESPEFPGWPPIPADVEPTNYLGERFNDYALPGAPIRDDDDPTWFELVREPRRIQLPAIDHEDGWETQIQVQNGGDEDTGAIVFFWGEYSGQCPYSDPGPISYACKWVAENGLWSLKDQIIPSAAKSAIVYAVDEDLLDDACAEAAYVLVEPNWLDTRPQSRKWRDWEDGYTDLQGRYHEPYEGTGEPIAVVVQRTGPNDHGTMVSSAYPGISENNVGGGPPYRYFAPYAMRLYHNLDTEIIIHNSGQRCTEVWLEYQKQGDDGFSYEEHITQLAPGESIRKRVPAVLGAEWLGSIYVTADEPLGIVVDQTSFLPSDDQGTLLTYEARPYRLTTDTLFYADLIFREWSGWEASIQVQNLTQHSLPTFVTVEFFDASGDSILFLGDWVPRAGGATFYLPAVTDLGMGYAGAAVIQSHQQVDYPGQHHPNGEPIFAVVDLKKTKMYDEALHRWRHTIAGEIQGGAYNALAEGEKKEASAVMLPFLAKAKNDQGVTSLMAIRNNSNCNQIELKLEVRKGTGTVVSYVYIFNLPPGHIKLIDLANVGNVNPGFVGAGTVEVVGVRQLCDTDNDGRMDEAPTMLSVVVVNKGAGSGDITSVYEGVPLAYWGFP